jgi:tetratricopeptide (TPR) repeat protein
MTLSPRTTTLFVWTLCLVAPLGLAGVKRLPIDGNTPDGKLLAQVQAENDPAKRLYLLELFPDLFPTSPLAGYVWSELQERYRVAGKLDKALAAGAKLIDIEPNNLDASCLNWRIAADMKYPALETKWIAQTAAVAEHALKTPDPEMSKATAECGRNAMEAMQFEEYRKAVSNPNAAERIKALNEFVKNHPQTSHTNDIEIYQFLAYRELGNSAQALAAAEKIIAHDETRQDAMLLVADAYFKANRDPNRVLHLAKKTIELINAAEKPEGMSANDWTRSKVQNLTQLDYMIGFINFQDQHWEAVDQAYREALPNLTDPRARAEVLSSLGWANYQLRRVSEAIRFYTECTAIPGPLQIMASKTLNSITAEYRITK